MIKNKKELDNKLKRLIIENSIRKIDLNEIEEEDDLFEDFGFDSIQVVRLFSQIERELFKNENIDWIIITNYGELMNFILDKLSTEEL
ncbi:MAG: acyl carrier protein [Clostridiales bacterium]